MTIHESIQDKLSDYLDDELTDGERAEVEAHLAGCAPCSSVLAELKQVVALAASLPSEAPPRDLWRDISAGIESAASDRSPRRFSFTLPELAAASLLLATLSGGAVALMMNEAPVDVRGGAAAVPQTPVELPEFEPPLPAPSAATDSDVVPAVGFADAQFDAAVADLERALQRGRGRLDPETVSVVEENLSIIDRAIAEARSALESDPSNGYLSGHLMEARRRKLDLLRRAAALTDTN